MKTLKKYLIIIVGILVIFTGCSERLDLAPLDSPSNVTFYETQDQLTLAINGAYQQAFWLFFGWNPNIAFEQFDNMTDLGFERSHAGVKSIALGSHSSSTGEIVTAWNQFYRALSRINNLLDNMHKAEDSVSPEFFQQIEGEARFLRAFCYFYLTELYGDVALLNSVPKPEESQIGRTPKNQIVDFIIDDLDYAVQVLPETWSSAEEGRATKGAALALKARVALFNNEYELASQAAQQVINLNQYSLFPDYETLTHYAGKRSSEVILDIPFLDGVRTSALPRSRGPQGNGSWALSVPSQFLVDSYEAIDGKPIDESALYDPSYPFKNRDPRLDATIVRSQSIWNDYIFESHPDSLQTWIVDENGNKIERKVNNTATSAYGTFTGYIWRKYLDPVDFPENVTTSELNFILMRYAEVLLIYAEAKIESGNIDQSVLDAINEVRARAYGVDITEISNYPAITTTSQDELIKIIRRERKIEFAGEGLRLFDIRRWGIAEHVMNGVFVGRPLGTYTTVSTPEINEIGHPIYGSELSLYRNVEPRTFEPGRDYLWPIPQPELDVNDAMTQNPGY